MEEELDRDREERETLRCRAHGVCVSLCSHPCLSLIMCTHKVCLHECTYSVYTQILNTECPPYTLCESRVGYMEQGFAGAKMLAVSVRSAM